MSAPFIGQIIVFAGNFAPSGWAMCNGQILPISQNTALFAILGTTYGGDGQTNFALPDMRGRACVHMGQGPGFPYELGETGGAENVALTAGTTPAHTHGVMAAATGNSAVPGPTTVLGTSPTTTTAYVPLPSSTGGTTLAPATISPAGSSLPHENRQPFLAMNYVISLFGIFPSRN